MEFIIISIISIILVVILKYLFGYNIRKIKEIAENKELDEISKKYPSNIEMCREYLEKLNNQNVKIEENKDTEASLYIAITNKISIANISKSYTRIQTIAHECLHSIQNRRILLFNFIFSNILMIYFLAAIPLTLLKILNGYVFVQIYIGMSIMSYIVKAYLENDAMTKAFFVAKEYMLECQKENKEITDEDINKLCDNMQDLNKIGIPFTNFYLIFGIAIKIIILCVFFL